KAAAREERAREFEDRPLDQQDPALELGRPRHLRDVPDQLLPRAVGRVRLASEDEEHRAFRVAEQALQDLGAIEDERRALVGREAAPETDREHGRVVGVGGPEQAIEMRLAPLVAEVRLAEAMTAG